MNAISDFHHGGDPTRAFLAFSWCLVGLRPATRSWSVRGDHAHTLLWDFKWIVWALPQFPEIPLDRTLAVLDDMQRRYQLAGHSLHAVHQHRWLVAHHVGDIGRRARGYDRMLTAAAGRDVRLRRLRTRRVRCGISPASAGTRRPSPSASRSCAAAAAEQPQWMLTELLLPYLHTGRFDQARRCAPRTATARMRDDRHHLDEHRPSTCCSAG